MDVIRSFVCNQMVEVVRTVFLIGLYLTIMFSMNVKLSLVALLFIPIVGITSGVFYAKISTRFKAADEAEGDLTTCAQENLTAVRVVRAFGREQFEEEKFNRKNEYFSNLWIKLAVINEGDPFILYENDYVYNVSEAYLTKTENGVTVTCPLFCYTHDGIMWEAQYIAHGEPSVQSFSVEAQNAEPGIYDLVVSYGSSLQIFENVLRIIE